MSDDDGLSPYDSKPRRPPARVAGTRGWWIAIAVVVLIVAAIRWFVGGDAPT